MSEVNMSEIISAVKMSEVNMSEIISEVNMSGVKMSEVKCQGVVWPAERP